MVSDDVWCPFVFNKRHCGEQKMDKLTYLIESGRIGGVAEMIKDGVDKVYIVEECCRIGNDVVLGYMLRMDIPVDQNMLNVCIHYNRYRCCAMILDAMRRDRMNVSMFHESLMLAIDECAIDIVHLLCMSDVKVLPYHITAILDIKNTGVGVAILETLLDHIDSHIDVDKRVLETSFVKKLLDSNNATYLSVMSKRCVHLTPKQCDSIDKMCSLDIVIRR